MNLRLFLGFFLNFLFIRTKLNFPWKWIEISILYGQQTWKWAQVLQLCRRYRRNSSYRFLKSSVSFKPLSNFFFTNCTLSLTFWYLQVKLDCRSNFAEYAKSIYLSILTVNSLLFIKIHWNVALWNKKKEKLSKNEVSYSFLLIHISVQSIFFIRKKFNHIRTRCNRLALDLLKYQTIHTAYIYTLKTNEYYSWKFNGRKMNGIP